MAAEELERVDRPLAVLREQRPLVAAVVRDARHMPHQLAQGHGPLCLRERRHGRHEGVNLVVEVQLVFLQQQADRGRRERHGGGADPEARIWRDLHPALEIRPAKAFGPDDVATDSNRHGKARQVLLGESRTDDLPPLLHGAGPLWLRGRMRHGWDVLRVRMQGRRSGADVHPRPPNCREEQPDGYDNQRGPGFRPTPQHVPSTSSDGRIVTSWL